MDSHSIFDKIIYIGPDIRMIGGIASVLRSYRDMVHPFHFIAVNSHRGRLVGYFSLLALFARLPFARLKGRKVVHIHYASGKSWIRESKIMSWARFWGYKTVMHCHAGLFPAYANKHPEVKNTLKHSDVNVVLSPKWIEIFRNQIGIDGTVSINNVIKPSTVKKVSNTDGPVVFTFIGDIIERKGIFDLIDAVDILPHDADFRIEICGRGETERLQRRIASSHHTDKINFHGAVSPDQRDFILSRTSVVVLPSYAEEYQWPSSRAWRPAQALLPLMSEAPQMW